VKADDVEAATCQAIAECGDFRPHLLALAPWIRVRPAGDGRCSPFVERVDGDVGTFETLRRKPDMGPMRRCSGIFSRC